MNAKEAVNKFIDEGMKERRWQSGSEPGARFFSQDMEDMFNAGLKEANTIKYNKIPKGVKKLDRY